jgi:hypothetical protein
MNKKTYSIITILAVISVSSLLMNIYNFKNASTNDSRINKITEILQKQNWTNKDSITNEVKFLEFKQEYYTQQLGIQSDWFILYVTVLFGVFGIVGYTFFMNQINTITTEANNAIARQEKIHDEHRLEFIELKKDTLKTNSDMYSIGISSHLSMKNYVTVTVLSILTAKQNFELAQLFDKDDDNYSRRIENTKRYLQNALNGYQLQIKETGKFEFGKNDIEVIKSNLDAIFKCEDIPTRDLVTKVRYILFIENDKNIPSV